MGQDVAIIAETVTTTAGGVTIGSGGSMVLSSGSLVLSSGSLKLTGGNVSMASGVNFSIASGPTLSASNMIVPGFDVVGAPGSSSSSIATSSGSIPLSQGIVRVSATGTATSCTIAVGTLDGQVLVVLNESANPITIMGNTKTIVTLAASSAVQYVWVSTDTLWWHLT